MGKQSRRKGGQERGAEAAARYLRRLGLPDRADASAYRRLAEADPGWFARISELDDRSVALAGQPGSSVDELRALAQAKYGLIYRDLDTALAEYAARAVTVAAAWLGWWLERHPPATRLLDVGCGAGVLTCAYALALPEAEVVGADNVPEAVACAEELARRVGAGNASFVVADFAAAGPAGGGALGEGHDQLVAVTALGDAGLYPQQRSGQDPWSSLAEVDGPGLGYRSAGVSALADRLAPDGWFLAFDRTPEATQAVWLGAALSHAGIDLDLGRAGTEELPEDGERRTFTRFAGRRTVTPGPAAATAPAPATAELARWVKAAAPPAYGRAWHDELRFERLRAAGAALVAGAEIDYAPHAVLVERREVWAHGAVAYRWETNTLGLRELTQVPGIEAAVAETTAYVRKWSAAGLRVRTYR